MIMRHAKARIKDVPALQNVPLFFEFASAFPVNKIDGGIKGIE
jgi:hypothetical protein